MDENSGAPWHMQDIAELARCLKRGNTIAEVARILCRDEDQVRQKANNLGLEQLRL